jgi:hypothetical protein
MKYVKLTDEQGETRNHTKWGPGVVHRTSGQGGLCGEGWLHCYGSDTESRAALLAVLLSSLHCNFRPSRGWRVECRGEIKSDNGLKFGTTEMECLEEIVLPNVTTTQRVAFAILCASKGYKDPKFQAWGQEWLSGRDRSAAAARSAAEAAWGAAESARSEVEAGAWAAEAAWGTVEAAARAADEAVWEAATRVVSSPLDLGSIAEEAMSY